MAELKVKLLNLPKERRAEFILSVVPEGDNFNRSRRFSQFLPPSPAAYRNGEPYQPPEELAEVTTFPRLPPGKAKLVLSHKFGAESYSILTLLIQDIVIRESGSEETLTVPALYDLVVTPEPGVNYRYMSVAIPEEYGAQMAKQSDGSYILRQLPAGEYLVTAGTVGGMYVSVPADGPIAFRASPANAYRVTGYDGAGAYYRSGLRTGDLIVAMNGERATSYETLRSLREKSAEAATLRLEIVREGRNLEITLTGDDWRKAWKESTGLGYTVAK
jgi:hypothetical protein